MSIRDKVLQVGINSFKEVARYYPFLPRLIRVESTKACNLKCSGCRRQTFTETLSKGPGPVHLTVEELKVMVESCPIRVVCFEGDGEPMVNPHFSQLLEWLKDKSIRSILGTNATLIDEAWVKKFKECGITRVHASVDGARKETFEKWRRGADFDKVMWTCELLGNSGIQLFLNCVLSSEEILEELPEYLELAKRVGATGILLMKPQYEIPPSNGTGLVGWEGYIDGIIRKGRSKGLIITGIHYGSPTFAGCWDAWTKPMIILGGDVYACGYMANLRKYEVYSGKKLPVPSNNYKMGNIYDKPLRDIWREPAYKELRKTLRETEKPKGTRIDEEALLNLKENLGDERFAYCEGCLCRWSEAGL